MEKKYWKLNELLNHIGGDIVDRWLDKDGKRCITVFCADRVVTIINEPAFGWKIKK